MSVTQNPPNTIFLGGKRTTVNDLAAGVAIVPGMLIEKYVPSGVINRVRPHATASVATEFLVALDAPMLGKGVDDSYAVADLVDAAVGHPGSEFWMIIKSGQSISFGGKLESAGDGSLKAFNTGIVLAEARETKVAASTGNTRIRVVVV